MTSKRILYMGPEAARELASLEFEELGRVDNGVWVACPDSTVRALAQRVNPVLLYFDRYEYDRAIADLSGVQTQEVIRKRRDQWAPQAASYLMSRLFTLERLHLEAALGVPAGDQVNRSLMSLEAMAGLDRYNIIPAKALAVTIAEGEAMLLATLVSALNNGLLQGDSRDLAAWHRERRQVWSRTVARVAVALGVREFANAFPYADPVRGVFVHPADVDYERGVQRSGEPAVRWRDGLVHILAERRFEVLRERGLTVKVLYANAGDCLGMLTTAQLHRDFATRLDRPEAESKRDFLAQIDVLHLHQILMKSAFRRRGDASRACESAGMDAVLREEVEVLRHSLERTRSFSGVSGIDPAFPRPALLRETEELCSEELTTFESIARLRWPSVAPLLTNLQLLRTRN